MYFGILFENALYVSNILFANLTRQILVIKGMIGDVLEDKLRSSANCI